MSQPTHLQRMITARNGLLKATLRKTRPRTDLAGVVAKLDAAIAAIQSQGIRTRQVPMFRSAFGHPSLKRKPMTRLIAQIEEDEMRLDDAQIAAIRRRNR